MGNTSLTAYIGGPNSYTRSYTGLYKTSTKFAIVQTLDGCWTKKTFTFNFKI